MSDSPVAIVTGGAQGIGAAICKELLKKGYRVCVADIQDSKAEEFSKEQQFIYGKENVIALRCDVSEESDFTNLFEQTLEKFKRIDLLVNNAGILLEQNPRKCLEVNLIGTLIGCYTAMKYMGKSKGGNGGVVINISSVTGFIPTAEVPAYTASKHGVIGLTRSLGLPFHYDKDGIIFAALCPGTVHTDMIKPINNRSLKPGGDGSKRFKTVSVEFVAKGVLKVLDDKINGSTLLIINDGYQYQKVDENLKALVAGDGQ
ncbi:unnamed protein product [Larinioides sclopetarius]|uniref:15-hydroxyprostaglandin dehydrogenase [NAD(+)] n=1 Tax=Larinioides sclopetarius TaxID=280406 RepID=A0AAV2B8L0_9ARAC